MLKFWYRYGRFCRVAVTHPPDLDLSAPALLARRNQRVRLGRRIHHIPQAFHRDARLLELLPQADHAQHRLAQAAREHLERDQHADGKILRAHHQPGTRAQDQQRQQLLQRVGQHVVGVRQLAALKPGLQQIGKVVAVALCDLRLHLQRLHGFDTGDVFGDESLVARADQKLVVEPLPQQRGYRRAQDDHQRQHRQRHQRQQPTVVKHDGEKNQQERYVQDQRDRRAADEFAYALDALQACHHGAGGAVLEIARRQLEQVLEHLGAEHRINAVAGVVHQVLPHPAHQCGEHHKQGHADTDGPQRVDSVVYHHLVYHHLGEHRCRQRHQLQHQRSQQHVAPDRLVLEQFRHEPAETEFARTGFFRARFRWRELQRVADVTRGKLCQRRGPRLLFGLPGRLEKMGQAVFYFKQQSQRKRRLRFFSRRRFRLCARCRFERGEARQSQLAEIVCRNCAPAAFHAQRLHRALQRGGSVRRGELAQRDFRRKRHPVQLARPVQRPDEGFRRQGLFILGQGLPLNIPPPLTGGG